MQVQAHHIGIHIPCSVRKIIFEVSVLRPIWFKREHSMIEGLWKSRHMQERLMLATRYRNLSYSQVDYTRLTGQPCHPWTAPGATTCCWNQKQSTASESTYNAYGPCDSQAKKSTLWSQDPAPIPEVVRL